jgi:hypothetical protein
VLIGLDYAKEVRDAKVKFGYGKSSARGKTTKPITQTVGEKD